MKTPFHPALILGLTLLTSLALPVSFAAPDGAPATRASKTKTLAGLPLDARKAISNALKREGMLAPETRTEDAILLATDFEESDRLGSSVAISGNVVVVGAPGADTAQGAAYVFVKPAGGWADGVESAKLIASDGQPR